METNEQPLPWWDQEKYWEWSGDRRQPKFLQMLDEQKRMTRIATLEDVERLLSSLTMTLCGDGSKEAQEEIAKLKSGIEMYKSALRHALNQRILKAMSQDVWKTNK